MSQPRLSALSFFLLAACVHAAPATATATATILLIERQSVTVAPGAVLTYDSVADSRCPPDVRCVMAGKVVYSFTLTLGQAVEHFTLSPAAPAYTSAALGGTRITLADAAPPAVAKAAGAAHPISIQVVAA